MNKLLLAFILLTGNIVAAISEENNNAEYPSSKTEKVAINKPFDNIFINAGSGVQLYSGFNDSKLTTHERLMRSYSFNMGKWFTPVSGIRIGCSGFKFRTFDPEYQGTTENETYDSKTFRQIYLNLDYMINVTEALLPYKPARNYSLTIFAGAGLRRNLTTDRSDYALNYGIINNFKIAERIYLTFDFKGAAMYGFYNGNKRKQLLDHFFSLNAGLTVNIGRDSWTKATDNRDVSDWFVSLGAGAFIYDGDYDYKGKMFSERIGPGASVAVGKWITPVLGARVMYEYMKFKGISVGRGNLAYCTGEISSSGDYRMEIYGSHPHADLMFNVSNLIGGYNEERIYSCVPYIGAGYILSKRIPLISDILDFTANAGIYNKFRITKKIDLFAEIRISSVDSFFNAIRSPNHKNDEFYSMIFGVTYNLK